LGHHSYPWRTFVGRSNRIGHRDVCFVRPLQTQEIRGNCRESIMLRTFAAEGVDAIRFLISAAIVINAASTLVASANGQPTHD